MAKDGKAPGVSTVVDSPYRTRVSHVTPIELPEGRFHDEGPIGDGGRSRVHMIYDRTLLRRSAMKILAQQLPCDIQTAMGSVFVLSHPL